MQSPPPPPPTPSKAELKLAEKSAKLKLKREEAKLKAIETWKDVLKNWEKKKNSEKVRTLVKNGVPGVIRPKVWPLLIGNALQINSELFRIFNSKAIHSRMQNFGDPPPSPSLASASAFSISPIPVTPSPAHRRRESDLSLDAESSSALDDDSSSATLEASSFSSSSSLHLAASPRPSSSSSSFSSPSPSIPDPSFTPIPIIRQPDASSLRMYQQQVETILQGQKLSREHTARLIQVDLHRTFPQLAIFQPNGPLYEPLNDILSTFCSFRPDVGYVQGQSFVAAVLLLNLDTVEAFQVFANMLNHPHFQAFYRMNVEEVDKRIALFNQIFRQFLPNLHRHFAENGIDPRFYILDWFLTLFCKSLPIDVASRIVDRFLLDGDIILFRAALGVLHFFQDRLLKSDFDGVLGFLTHLPADIPEYELMDSISTMKLTRKRFKKAQADAQKVWDASKS